MKTKHPRLLLPLVLTGALTSLAHAQLKTGSNTGTITATANFEVESTTGNKTVIDKTSGNLGIGITTPATTLTVNGGIATNYTAVTATTYTLLSTDSTVAWNGSAEGNITLPAAVSGSGNFKGRTYTLKNTSNAHNVIVTAAGSESIGNGPSLSLTPQASLILISTGATSGSTWQVVSQTGTFGIGGGSYSAGYDLTGLPSVTQTLTSGTGAGQWDSAGDVSETSDSACDVPIATMTTLMNSLPDGGIIKLQFPTITSSSSNCYIDFGLPDAAGYVGKTFYMYMNISQTAGITCVPSNFSYNRIFGNSSDGIQAVDVGDNPYTGGNLNTSSSTFNYGLLINSGANVSTLRYISTPILKITAVSANLWYVEGDVGRYYNFN